jgi:hypothetical protein
MYCALSAIIACASFGFFVVAAPPALAAVTTGSCPRLTATPYVIAGTSMGGSHYVIMVANEDCTQVSAWVKKIVAQHMSGNPDDSKPFGGGPAGYTCEASPDGAGHPYQGRCEKNGDKNTAFSWIMGG